MNWRAFVPKGQNDTAAWSQLINSCKRSTNVHHDNTRLTAERQVVARLPYLQRQLSDYVYRQDRDNSDRCSTREFPQSLQHYLWLTYCTDVSVLKTLARSPRTSTHLPQFWRLRRRLGSGDFFLARLRIGS